MYRARSYEGPKTGSGRAGMFTCWSLHADTSASSPPSLASSRSLAWRYLALWRDRWGLEHGLAVRRMAVAERLHGGFDDPVDQAVVLRRRRRHEEVTLDVPLDLFGGSAGVLGVDADDNLPEPEDLAGMNLDVRGLRPSHPATGLVEHDLAMGQREPLALRPADQDQRRSAGGHAGAQGADGRMDVTHGVVDRESCRERAARAVDVNADLLVRVLAVEKEQLRDHEVGDVIIDLAAQKNDAVAQQPGVDVVGALTARGALDDVGDEGHEIPP